jgi:hypothetical protein
MPGDTFSYLEEVADSRAPVRIETPDERREWIGRWG